MTRSRLERLTIDDHGDMKIELVMRSGDDGPSLLVTKYEIDENGFRLSDLAIVEATDRTLQPDEVRQIVVWLMRYLHGVLPPPEKV